MPEKKKQLMWVLFDVLEDRPCQHLNLERLMYVVKSLLIGIWADYCSAQKGIWAHEVFLVMLFEEFGITPVARGKRLCYFCFCTSGFGWNVHEREKRRGLLPYFERCISNSMRG